ncbi:hypothetical protein SSP35_02_02480 [Streptomyces sp. NBRC 110611]|nr:hypothetical protein SSP35_02_02480 [Streptomyces sp. NBRC 110611]
MPHFGGATRHKCCTYVLIEEWDVPSVSADLLAQNSQGSLEPLGRALADFCAAALGWEVTKPAHQPGAHWTVLLDPSGQPFCLSATPHSA